MPITRRQFDLGIDPTLEQWMTRIHKFLEDHRNEAFSEPDLKVRLSTDVEAFDEAWKAERGLPSDASVLTPIDGIIRASLTKLVEILAAEARDVEYTTYYAYRDELPDLH